ncbi:MAG: radical SAM protein, partial [Candidatus Binatia bacterium]
MKFKNNRIFPFNVKPISVRLGWMHKRLHDGMNYRLRTFAGGRWASYCRPTWISFLLTERCNARCIHCNIWQNRGKEDSPTPEQWKAALSDLRNWLGPAHVCLTGGEALLKPYTVDLVAHGSAIGLFIEVLSHGYWQDQGRIERLALANPSRITLSLDGIGETHDKIRGREGFFQETTKTLETLKRLRKEKGADLTIRLKTVVMSHNLDDVCELARYATQDGIDILYQPIVQNYGALEDAAWFAHSDNWPKDGEKAAAVVRRLMRMKRQGFSIANTDAELEVMISYFRNPDAWRVSTQGHTAHERKTTCAALGLFEVQANGDVKVCSGSEPVGNIKCKRPREIWRKRPHWWEFGCCLERRVSAA